MLIIIASKVMESRLDSSVQVTRLMFPVPHPDDLPAIVHSANRQMQELGLVATYRMFAFVDCGKAVVYDVDENGKWGEK